MKAVLYRTQFQNLGLFTQEEALSHVDYVRFLLKHYVRQWLQSPSVADAPLNDLTLYRDHLAVKPSWPSVILVRGASSSGTLQRQIVECGEGKMC